MEELFERSHTHTHVCTVVTSQHMLLSVLHDKATFRKGGILAPSVVWFFWFFCLFFLGERLPL